MANNISVEIIYADAQPQWLQPVSVPRGATIQQALNVSGFFEKFPKVTPEAVDVGVFSIRKRLNDVLRDRDRIEIYKPLLCDPKAARRVRG